MTTTKPATALTCRQRQEALVLIAIDLGRLDPNDPGFAVWLGYLQSVTASIAGLGVLEPREALEALRKRVDRGGV